MIRMLDDWNVGTLDGQHPVGRRSLLKQTGSMWSRAFAGML